MELVEQVGVGRQTVEMGLDHVAREPPIGDDLVEMGHEVVLGHGRQRPQPGFGEARGVDSCEPGAVPRRALSRVRDDRPQPGLARGAQLVGRPRETRKQLRKDLEEERKMPLPESLVLGHYPRR